uniref:Uncharacterized protein n=1 Tax=Haptolina ericina TaxID=156174 RepID=A0A7S3FF97_9EUKA|mmetsp:Transcript_67582/g.150854  ORF Transcript_67582/g.150854 Transcript_67582/m.150854 type:complete len:147 (+) Transcript_67582:592-1032(+)
MPGTADGNVQDAEVNLVGPSAGQTAILILIDNVMGVTHSPRMHEFRKSMYEYLPAKHGQLLRDIDADLALSGTVREAAAKVGEDSELARASADALSSLAAMRAFHLGMATNFLRAALKGTGDSDFRALLNDALKSTRSAAAQTAVQ